MKTPTSVHEFLTRSFPEKIPDFEYDVEMKILKVTQIGAIRWKAYNCVYLVAKRKGKHIGALDIGNGIWRVYYRNVFLGYFDEHVFRKNEQAVRLETNLV